MESRLWSQGDDRLALEDERETDVVLRIEHLSKTFPGQVALDDVSLDIRAGEVHALVGQNGSGKSTLIKVLAGYHQPESGARVYLRGVEYDPGGLGSSHRHALGFVHQDLALVPSMSAVDNIALSRGFETGRSGGIRWKTEIARAHRLVREFGADFDVRLPVSALSPVQRSVVAMARALHAAPGQEGQVALLVLDEPTASLPFPEVRRLFDAIRRVAAAGTAVLYVSHHLDEVFELADRVSIVRDGRLVTTVDVRELDHAELVELIVGRRLDEFYTPPPAPRPEVVLDVANLGGERLRDVSFQIHAGEILGVTGILGSGHDEVAPLLFGVVPGRPGTVSMDGKVVAPGSPRAALAAGMAMVPVDRIGQGLVASQSVRENIVLPRLRPLMRPWGLARRAEQAEVRDWIHRVDLRPPDPEYLVSSLSGGNQQKAVLAKWLRTEPRVLLLDEPTRGVDVGAKAAVFKLLSAAAAKGVAILYSSVEAEDLSKICDRVIVLRDGAIGAVLSGDSLDEHRIIQESVRPATRRDPTSRPSRVATAGWDGAGGGQAR